MYERLRLRLLPLAVPPMAGRLFKLSPPLPEVVPLGQVAVRSGSHRQWQPQVTVATCLRTCPRCCPFASVREVPPVGPPICFHRPQPRPPLPMDCCVARSVLGGSHPKRPARGLTLRTCNLWEAPHLQGPKACQHPQAHSATGNVLRPVCQCPWGPTQTCPLCSRSASVPHWQSPVTLRRPRQSVLRSVTMTWTTCRRPCCSRRAALDRCLWQCWTHPPAMLHTPANHSWARTPGSAQLQLRSQSQPDRPCQGHIEWRVRRPLRLCQCSVYNWQHCCRHWHWQRSSALYAHWREPEDAASASSSSRGCPSWHCTWAPAGTQVAAVGPSQRRLGCPTRGANPVASFGSEDCW
jgi:hypothetical protein